MVSCKEGITRNLLLVETVGSDAVLDVNPLRSQGPGKADPNDTSHGR